VQPRPATLDDVPAIRALVAEAYQHYVPLIGKPPSPMLDDYTARVREDLVFVRETAGAIAGVLVLKDASDHMLLHNIAVAPRVQGQGLGTELVRFAESEAHQRGYSELRLYTHEVMQDNVRLYQRLGFVITHRAREDGYDRIYMTKAV
jgi:ribosomal protein S18 acetylase RimI-like enzyme